jgi:hypothetical protein
MNKSSFNNHLEIKIKESLRGITVAELVLSDKDKVKKVLLLYNILTMLQNDRDDSKFPFDIFKKDDWDIEHITAVREEMPKESEMKQWVHDVIPYINPKRFGARELSKRLSAFDGDTIAFPALFNDIVSHFEENVDDDNINHISNLALLDAKTNRSYKNAVFPVKRKTIIERDKNGTFIPLCTKNVFLKYFTDYPPKISFWTPDDRDKYREDLEVVLKNYLEG